MGYVVVSPCHQTAADASSYAAVLPSGYQILSCTSVSAFVELTPAQKVDLFTEGSALGAGVSAVWVAVWAVVTLRRALL